MTYPGLIHDIYYLYDTINEQPLVDYASPFPSLVEFWLDALGDPRCEIRVWAAEPEIVVEKLNVPWISQLGPDAAFAPGDCGPACLASWLYWLGERVTVDEVSAQSGLDRGYKYTTPAHLIHAARHWNVELYWKRYLKLDDLRAEIDAGQPCIVLVNYPSLPVRYDPNYKDGHWLLVVGYGTECLVYHDPYYYPSEGAFIRVGINDFDRAWGNNHLNGNSDRQALRLRR